MIPKIQNHVSAFWAESPTCITLLWEGLPLSFGQDLKLRVWNFDRLLQEKVFVLWITSKILNISTVIFIDSGITPWPAFAGEDGEATAVSILWPLHEREEVLLRIQATCNRVQGHYLVSGKLAVIPNMGFSCLYTGKRLKWLHVKVNVGSTCLREGVSSGEPFVNYTNLKVSF